MPELEHLSYEIAGEAAEATITLGRPFYASGILSAIELMELIQELNSVALEMDPKL